MSVRLFYGCMSYFGQLFNITQRLILHVLGILKAICWMNIIFGIMDQCDIKIDLIKYM